MNSDEAVRLATRLAWNHRVQVRKTGTNPDDYDVVVLDDSSSDPLVSQGTQALSKATEERLGRVEHILEERAKPRASKVENLRRIQRVVDSYLRKVQRLRGHRDMEIAVEGEQIHEELESVSDILSELVKQEEVGRPADDDSLQIDLFHRVSVIAQQMARRLRASRGHESIGGGAQNSPGVISKKRKKS